MNTQAQSGHQDEAASEQWRWRLQTLWVFRAVPALTIVVFASLRVLS
jgi:hypothetical protein